MACVGAEIPRNRYWDVLLHVKELVNPAEVSSCTVRQESSKYMTILGEYFEQKKEAVQLYVGRLELLCIGDL